MPVSNARPHWLRKKLVSSDIALRTSETLANLGVNTVCESALCPNLNECFAHAHATFLIFGNVCTRGCGFCSVTKGAPPEVDSAEPYRIAEAVKFLKLEYVVLTSVTRDDLPDGGADQFVKVIEAIRESSGGVGVEVLVPDFRGDIDSVKKVLGAAPEVFAHNVETVSRLYPAVRSTAYYNRSLTLLANAKLIAPGQIVKSGLMVGLGENENEVIDAITDIAHAGCDILTIGQYLRPSKDNVAVERFVTLDEFELYKKAALAAGIREVVSGPFVRSSYRAGDIYNNLKTGVSI